MVGYLPLPPSDTPRRAPVPVSRAEPTANPDEAGHERIGTSSSVPPGPEPVWRPLKPPLIVVDPSFVLDRWRPNDGAALRRFDLDPDTARFFGYTVEQAQAMPDSHYDGDMRARGSLRAWRDGKQLNLAIRRRADGEAVGWVELQPVGSQAEVPYNVTADLRGQGIAPRCAQRVSHLGRGTHRPSPRPPRLPRRQPGLSARGGEVRLRPCRPGGRRVPVPARPRRLGPAGSQPWINDRGSSYA